MTDSELIGKLNEFFKRQRCYTAKITTDRREELYWAKHYSGWRLCLWITKLTPLEECPLPNRVAALKAVPQLYLLAREAFESLHKELSDTIASVSGWLQVNEATEPIPLTTKLPE